MDKPLEDPTTHLVHHSGRRFTRCPVLISHDGHLHGIHLHLTPLGARVLLGTLAGELANTIV